MASEVVLVNRVMIIAGEASGDLHGAGVARELKKLSPSIDIYGVGGDKMEREGVRVIYNIRELGFMGFWEVIVNLYKIKTMEYTLKQILKFKKPDILVLIDYPGFNIRFGMLAKQYQLKIIYYISPQIWAWNKSRIKKMQTFVDKMLVIFPFEVDIYKSKKIDVEFVGHPLLEVMESSLDKEAFSKRFDLDPKKKIIALLPGSRLQEVDQILPEMLSAARKIKENEDVEIVIGLAPTLEEKYIRTFFDVDGVHIIAGLTYELMANADFAFVTSGTATLETACFGTPMFILYKTSWINYIIGRLLVRLKYIGLVNIVAGKKIVPEFIQYRVKASLLARSALKLLRDEQKLAEMKKELLSIRSMLGNKGASKRVAEQILQMN